VPKDAYLKAFPIMLKGAALNYYYMNCKLESLLLDLYNNIKQYFEGAAYKWNILKKWNNLTLKEEINKNPEKSVKDCLQLLI
jgi:hypothetical protein